MKPHLPSVPRPSAEDLANTPPSVVAWSAWLEHRVTFWEEFAQESENRAALQEKRLASQEERIRELEAKLGMNSTNSNLPPSSDPPYTKKPKANAPKTLRKPRKGIRQKMLEPTREVNCQPEPCTCGCGDVLDATEYYRHQHIEIPIPALDVTHFVLHRGTCAACGKTVKAVVPDEYRFGYGPRVHALTMDMVGMLGLSRDKLHTLFLSIYGLHISAGGIQKCLDRAKSALLPHYEAIKRIARSAEVNYIDETTWRRTGPLGPQLLWLWVMTSSTVAFFMVHANRSKAAFLNLIGDWRGVLVCDGYGVYKKWDGIARQTCLAHLIRAAKALKEGTERDAVACGSWAHRELKRICRMAKTPPSHGERLMAHARLCRLVQMFKACKGATGRFARRIHRELPHMFVFLEHHGASPTNNHAERSLRHAVLWRKTSNGTVSEKGDRFVEQALSLRHTCSMRKLRTFPLLVDFMTNLAQNKEQDTSWLAA